MTNRFLRSVFGDLFADQSIAATFDGPAFTAKMVEFEAAWTRALRDTGVATVEDAQAALAALDRFGGLDLGPGSAVDGVPVPAFVRALRTGLEDGPAKAIHTGATSQDVMDCAMALTLVHVHGELVDRLTAMAARLAELAQDFGGRSLMARTRMQAALPANAALRIEAWRRAVEGQIARADAARAEIAKAQVGGAIGCRDAPDGCGPQIAEKVAVSLGLALAPVWHSDRSGPVSFGHWLTLVSGSMGKIGQDIALMAQQGIDEIGLRGGGGSSAMPHKQNPVAAEAMVSLARYVAVQQGALAQAMIHEQERSGTAWALEWMTLPAMAEATGAAVNAGQKLMDQIDWIGAPD